MDNQFEAPRECLTQLRQQHPQARVGNPLSSLAPHSRPFASIRG